MPIPTATTTQTRTVTIRPTLKRKLLTELKTYAEIKSQVKVLEHALDGHKTAIEAIREETGESTLELEGFTITRVQSDYTSITKELLLQFGIPMSTIEEIWAAGRRAKKPFTKVSLPNEREGEGQ